MTCVSSIAISAEQYGDWSVDKSIPGVQIANTKNDSDSTLGVICLVVTKDCSAYMLSNNGCDENSTYPMMINSTVGAFPITSVCTQIEKLKILVINEFDNAKNAFESGGEIGFAVPLNDGKFKVVRFSTSGAVAAIKNAMLLPVASKSSLKKDEIF